MTGVEQQHPSSSDQLITGGAGRGLVVCIAASTVSSLGDSIQGFALGWQASGFGPGIAGLVATLGNLPRVLLILIGGAAADRYGIRRMMIICDAVMVAVLSVALGILRWQPAGLVMIIVLTVIGSVVSAFAMPAAGGFVRLFVPAEQLPRVLARIGGLQQIARVIGPSAGAVLVITLGLTGVIAINLVSFLIVLLALAVIRPPITLDRSDASGEKLIGGVLMALRSALRISGMLPALATLGLVAGSVLPILYLLVPLEVRAKGWGVATAGWLESAWIIGTLTITVIVAVAGTFARAGMMIIIGPLAAAAGGAAIALAPSAAVAVGGSVLMGIGTAIFTGHLNPLFLAWTPPALTARFQSLFVIVQSIAVLLANLPYGWLAGAIDPSAAMITAAIVCGLAGMVAGSSRRLRSARNPVASTS